MRAGWLVTVVFLGCSLLLGAVSGCSKFHRFEVDGIVQNADGKPLPGVTATLDDYQFRNDDDEPITVITGPDGRFHGKFKVSYGSFMNGKLPHILLTLAKVGYHDQVVDISPKEEPSVALTKIDVQEKLKPK